MAQSVCASLSRTDALDMQAFMTRPEKCPAQPGCWLTQLSSITPAKPAGRAFRVGGAAKARARRALSAVLLQGLLLTNLSACKDKTPKPDAVSSSPIKTQLAKIGPAWLKALAAAKTAKPSGCDEQKLKALIGNGSAKVVVAGAEQIDAVARGVKPQSTYSFLHTKKLGGLNLHPKSDEEAILALSKYHDLKSKYPVLGVVSVQDFTVPSEKDGQFAPGTFTATLSLFAMGESEPLCTSEVSAQSAMEVAKRQAESTQQALMSDFENRIRSELADSVKQLSRQLSL